MEQQRDADTGHTAFRSNRGTPTPGTQHSGATEGHRHRAHSIQASPPRKLTSVAHSVCPTSQHQPGRATPIK